ncbi:tRNA A37 N6-isopentenylltransferase MiaA [Bacillus ectoiniformans]|uniref:general stress protein n=1 Tax=Bacillus ectoiniformans TaxID=1494429 RepID=UPI00195D5587|nr:general stress protein [Bacillus ectoiniformans]MBM7647776.1 tRNA A37 N6-isopentenylltransferase MiaA [Bacillus ectoiniformans]
MITKKTVENAVQAKQEVDRLKAEGYSPDQIHIFAHEKERTADVNDALDTKEVGMKEQGLLDGITNMFHSRGDELREKMQAVGLTPQEAETHEKELDEGKLVVIANRS